MISINKFNDIGNNFALELYGLSTDTKPIGEVDHVKITNGSIFFAMDTGAVHIYDEKNEVWREV